MELATNGDKPVNAIVENTHSPAQLKPANIAALEAQYISLLETRIQELEVKVNASAAQQVCICTRISKALNTSDIVFSNLQRFRMATKEPRTTEETTRIARLRKRTA